MQAVILAGGLGTRFRSVVADRPKPMAEAGGRPFLEYQIEFLKRYGIPEFVLCVGYLRDHIIDHFGDGSRWGVTIRYSIEETPLGTGGALKLAEKHVRGTFLALNGDTYFDVDVGDLLRFHASRRARDPRCAGTLALSRARDARSYGAVVLDHDHVILSFDEKPAASSGIPHLNGGVYVLEPEVLGFLPALHKASVETDLFPAVLRSGQRLYGYPSDGFFVDIGTPDGYRKFCDHNGYGGALDHPKQGPIAD